MKKLIAGALLAFSFAAHAEEDEDLLSILGTKNEKTTKGAKAKKQKSASEDTAFVKALKAKMGTRNAEQNILLGFLNEEKFTEALYQWSPAFPRGGGFAASDEGKALYGYLLYKNGLEVTGLEVAMTVSNPESLSKAMETAWQQAVPANSPVWGLLEANPAAGWKDVFGANALVAMKLRKEPQPSEATLEALLKTVEANTPVHARLKWQLALERALDNKTAASVKMLKELLDGDQTAVGEDMLNLSAARLLYQGGYLEAAGQYYERVPKSSDNWYTAQEELAWSYLRRGQPQDALAVTQGLSHEKLAALVGPETLFVRSLAQLKVCDYAGVISSINAFRDRFRERVKQLRTLASQADTPAAKELLVKVAKGDAALKDLGPITQQLPRLIARDDVLRRHAFETAALATEAAKATSLYETSLPGGTAKVGYQAEFEELKKRVARRQQAAQTAAYNYVSKRAQEEVEEISDILRKMHIVEAELMQQLEVAQAKKAQPNTASFDAKTGSTGSQAEDKLRFPYQGETWFDELANYRVDVKKGCRTTTQKDEG